MKKKTVALFAAFVLIVVSIVGGTLAWLTDQTEGIVNTFTTSDIHVTLTESVDTDGDGKQSFQMIPGYTIQKDPVVTVQTGSEECYLFVQLATANDFAKYLTYEMAADASGSPVWTQLKDKNGTDVKGVFYRMVTAADMGKPYSVLKNDQVSVLDSVTKADMETLDQSGAYPTLTVKAYASQYHKNATEIFQPHEAWANDFNPTGAIVP